MKAENPRVVGRAKRRVRIRKKIAGTAERPRLTVYRSLKHISAQLVDDATGASLGAVSSRSKALAADVRGTTGKVEAARIVGRAVARLAQEKHITRVVFDRNGYLFHGRVKAVADGAREGGLQF